MSDILLSYEMSVPGRHSDVLPELDVPEITLSLKRQSAPLLPQLSEQDVSRHYTQLAQRSYGVNCGFYPLGSCTMKYNPAIDEAVASLEGFTGAHPLAPESAVSGCQRVLDELKDDLCQLTGMDGFTLQPAAGAHGEFTGLLLIKRYHESRGDTKRQKILVPDSAHGTNPASAAMAGYQVVPVPSREDGCVDLNALDTLLTGEIAGMMMTNPNTLGLFEKDVLAISEKVHKAGGLMYYDGANLNAVIGLARPGDMGFDVTHLNLHKTFGTPHGGGGPGSGPVGVKKALIPFLPSCASQGKQGFLQMKAFYGNFLVCVKALCYLKVLGRENLRDVSLNAVLNANYLMALLKRASYTPAKDVTCMHEFVLSLEHLKQETGVTALDVAKRMIDHGVHPPTMYFPLIVHEALMFEPTETETKQTLDAAAQIMADILTEAHENPDALHLAPQSAVIGRPDEVAAARRPILRYNP